MANIHVGQNEIDCETQHHVGRCSQKFDQDQNLIQNFKYKLRLATPPSTAANVQNEIQRNFGCNVGDV